MGIRVKQFSVGVGPKVTGFTRRSDTSDGDDDDTNDERGNGVIDFNLRAIPLGGYVEFPENYNATMQVQMEIEAEEKRGRLKTFMEENDEDVASAVLRLMKEDGSKGGGVGSSGDEKRKWWQFGNGGKKNAIDSDSRVVVNKDGTVTVPPIEYYSDPDLLQNRSPLQRAIVLSGGVVFNLILSYFCFFGLLTTGGGLPKAVFNEGAVIGSVRDGTPSVGLLNRGDVIVALNGQSLSSTTSPSGFASQQAISKFVSNIKSTTPGESLTLSILQPTSANPRDITIQPQRSPDSPDSPISLGITLGPNFSRFDTIRASSLPDAITKSANEVSELSYETARSTLKAIGSMFSSSSSSQNLSGPIGVIRSGSDIVSRNDIRAVVGFVAVLSINLAVINSLPFPALDGGQLLFVVAEVVSGRKVDQKVQENINGLALLLLLSISLTATVGDVGSLISGR